MEGFPSLKSSLLKCIGQTYASLPVQKAAIQAFRLMEMESDVNQLLLRFTVFKLSLFQTRSSQRCNSQPDKFNLVLEDTWTL